MYGEVTSRNHQAYSWGHLVRNNMLTKIVLQVSWRWSGPLSEFNQKPVGIAEWKTIRTHPEL